MNYALRCFTAADLPHLAGIYRNAIRHLGSEFYSAQQIAAWSAFADDQEAFAAWFDNATALVAVDAHGTRLGFGAYQASGRIAALFVAPAAMRKGIGTALLTRMLDELRQHGVKRVTTEASEFSRPLFEKSGFTVKEIEHTEHRGVAFQRYVMYLDF